MPLRDLRRHRRLLLHGTGVLLREWIAAVARRYAAAFRVATGFTHTFDEGKAMKDFREAFPPPTRRA